MKYLTFDSRGPAKDGGLNRRIMLHEKTATTHNRKYIAKKRPIVITGYEDSGKTRQIHKIFNKSADLWKKKPSYFINCQAPLTTWLADELGGRCKSAQARYDEIMKIKGVFFVEDAHKLTGRKLQLVTHICSTNIFVMTCTSVNELAPTLRNVVNRSNYQHIKRKSDTAFDATGGLVWFLVLVLAGLELYEVAVLLGGAQMVARGRGAARQR